MITVLHGGNTVLSRQLLPQGKEVVRLSASELTHENLTQALEGQSLFGGQQPVVIEGLLSQRPSKTKDELVSIVASHPEAEVVLWEGKSVTAANIKKLKPAKVQEFKIPMLVFKFLDSFSLTDLHQAAKNEAIEFIFYLWHRRLSQLIQAKDGGKTLKGAPWQIGKLKAQAAKFSLAQLVVLQGKLLEIDYSIKSGQDDLPLLSQLDLVLVNF